LGRLPEDRSILSPITNGDLTQQKLSSAHRRNYEPSSNPQRPFAILLRADLSLAAGFTSEYESLDDFRCTFVCAIDVIDFIERSHKLPRVDPSPNKAHVRVTARGYCTVTLTGNPTRQFVARLEASALSLPRSPRAFLPLSDFDRQEIALNAITLAVRLEGREKRRPSKHASKNGWLGRRRGGGGGRAGAASSVVSFQGG